jgi:hypothetical protein
MTTSRSFEVHKIKNFRGYIDFIADFGDVITQNVCLFRGQCCDKPLVPRIGRFEEIEIKNFEKNLFEDFQKRYLAYSSKTYINDLDLLALGQHFGLPTRLLDWTESSLVALWFATEKDIEDEYAVVWMFIPDDKDNIDVKGFNPFTNDNTKVFSPNHISERITAQSGWFTCHKLMKNNKFLKFETLPKYKEKLIKIIIPKRIFAEIRVKLNTMGINSCTVYPDLIGLSKYLTWKHLKAERF